MMETVFLSDNFAFSENKPAVICSIMLSLPIFLAVNRNWDLSESHD